MLFMKHFLSSLATAAVLLTSAAGCTVIREVPAEQALPKNATPEMKLCRSLLEAFLKNDASGFVARLPEDTREQFDVRKFTSTRDYITSTMGQPVSFQYLTTLEFVTLSPHIWKIRFERQDKKGNTIRSEALFRIITGDVGQGKAAVIGFNFL